MAIRSSLVAGIKGYGRVKRRDNLRHNTRSHELVFEAQCADAGCEMFVGQGGHCHGYYGKTCASEHRGEEETIQLS